MRKWFPLAVIGCAMLVGCSCRKKMPKDSPEEAISRTQAAILAGDLAAGREISNKALEGRGKKLRDYVLYYSAFCTQ